MIDRHRFKGIRSPITQRRTRAPSAVPATISLAGPASVPSAPVAAPPLPAKVRVMPRWEWDRVGLDDDSFKQQFKTAFLTGESGWCLTRFWTSLTPENNWLRGGRVLASHTSQDSGVVTSLAVDANYLVIGMANSHIHIFDGTTGAFCRSLAGHDAGVWAIALVTPDNKAKTKMSPDPNNASGSRMKKPMPRPKAGASRRASFTSDRYTANVAPTQKNTGTSEGSAGIARPSTVMGITEGDGGAGQTSGTDSKPEIKQSDVCNASRGWGDERELIVSGGCDRALKVWDAATG